MSIKLESNIKDAEAWAADVLLPMGWHEVVIEDAEEGVSKKGSPTIKMRFVSPQGAITGWQTVVPNTYGKVAQLLDAVKIDRDGIDELDARQLLGKRLDIYVGEEPSIKDVTKMFPTVQHYALAGTNAGGTGETGNGPVNTSDFGAADGKDLPF